MREDYYELLDVPHDADRQQLRAAYRRQAMRYHPDHSGDDPAAEERFKLVAEAWRTLGDEELRADYDAWLDRHRRYERLPELASMPGKHVRVSSRQGAERRRERTARRESRSAPRPRLFLLRRVPQVGYVRYVIMCLFALLALQPFIRMYSSYSGERRAKQPEPVYPRGESLLPPEERIKHLENYVRVLSQNAQEGDASAQYRYGYLLHRGLEDVLKPDAAAAIYWMKLAAEQGNKNAIDLLAQWGEGVTPSPSHPQAPDHQ